MTKKIENIERIVRDKQNKTNIKTGNAIPTFTETTSTVIKKGGNDMLKYE